MKCSHTYLFNIFHYRQRGLGFWVSFQIWCHGPWVQKCGESVLQGLLAAVSLWLLWELPLWTRTYSWPMLYMDVCLWCWLCVLCTCMRCVHIGVCVHALNICEHATWVSKYLVHMWECTCESCAWVQIICHVVFVCAYVEDCDQVLVCCVVCAARFAVVHVSPNVRVCVWYAKSVVCVWMACPWQVGICGCDE